MRYEIMGPLRVSDPAGVTYLTARKVETLLACLLIRADRVVPFGDLTAEIWGDDPPARSRAAVHVYVSQVRRFLRRPYRSDSPVVTTRNGYLLRTGSDDIDVNAFVEQVDRGRAAALDNRHEQAVDRYTGALELWRGPVLGGARVGPVVDGFGTWLAERRLACVELLVESTLALGRHREVIGRLYALTVEHPLREAFYRQLMLALYRADRRADALRVYHGARRHLRAEIDREPGRPLQDLLRSILAGEDGPTARA